VRLPIRIALRPSRLQIGLLGGLHMLAAVSVAILPWSLWLRGALLASVVFLFWHLRPSAQVSGLRLGERGQLTLLDPQAEPLPVRVCPDTTVFSQLIVLRVREDESNRVLSFPLLPDSMSDEEFRRLRLWLRWQISDEAPTDGGA